MTSWRLVLNAIGDCYEDENETQLRCYEDEDEDENENETQLRCYEDENEDETRAVLATKRPLHRQPG